MKQSVIQEKTSSNTTRIYFVPINQMGIYIPKVLKNTGILLVNNSLTKEKQNKVMRWFKEQEQYHKFNVLPEKAVN